LARRPMEFLFKIRERRGPSYAVGIALLALLTLLEVEKSETLRTDLNVTAVRGRIAGLEDSW